MIPVLSDSRIYFSLICQFQISVLMFYQSTNARHIFPKRCVYLHSHSVRLTICLYHKLMLLRMSTIVQCTIEQLILLTFLQECKTTAKAKVASHTSCNPISQVSGPQFTIASFFRIEDVPHSIISNGNTWFCDEEEEATKEKE
uniref:Uncharacterized protein n=1 Tax=Arundo donax TaxID=35708 RepID=A0A0A8YK35_ARUDO